MTEDDGCGFLNIPELKISKPKGVLCAWCRQSIIVVGVFKRPVDSRFARLHDFSSDDHLVKDLVNLVKVEHKV